MICVGDFGGNNSSQRPPPLTTCHSLCWPPLRRRYCRRRKKLSTSNPILMQSSGASSERCCSDLDPQAKRPKDGRYKVFIHSVIWQYRVYPNYHEWRSKHWTQGTELDGTELQHLERDSTVFNHKFWLIWDCCPTKWPGPTAFSSTNSVKQDMRPKASLQQTAKLLKQHMD